MAVRSQSPQYSWASAERRQPVHHLFFDGRKRENGKHAREGFDTTLSHVDPQFTIEVDSGGVLEY